MNIQDRITDRKWKSDKEFDLKPCPFCGGEATLYVNDFSSLITCNDCGVTTSGRHSATIAVGVWNRRPDGNG
jgi:Lar family restriction alleviation protein